MTPEEFKEHLKAPAFAKLSPEFKDLCVVFNYDLCVILNHLEPYYKELQWDLYDLIQYFKITRVFVRSTCKKKELNCGCHQKVAKRLAQQLKCIRRHFKIASNDFSYDWPTEHAKAEDNTETEDALKWMSENCK